MKRNYNSKAQSVSDNCGNATDPVEGKRHKKFILFAWSDYYPQGGLDNLVASFDTIKGAKQAIAADLRRGIYKKGEHHLVVDRDTWEEVLKS